MIEQYAHAFKAEIIKGRHTSIPKLTFLMPLACIAIAIFFATTTDTMINGLWNWWYSLLLPGMVPIVCSSIANLDAKHKLRSVLGLAIPVKTTWMAKICYCLLYVLVANVVVFLGMLLTSVVFARPIDLAESLAAVVLLTATSAWIIPCSLALTTRFGTAAGILVPFLMQVIGGFGLWQTGIWWLCPPATSLCLMAPVLSILPNGLPVPAGSTLAVFDLACVAGLAISLLVFAVSAWMGSQWFARQEAM